MRKYYFYLERIFGIIFVPAVLLYINYITIAPWFGGNWTQHLASIEVSYITMAKWIVANWPNVTWQPDWYFGFPFHLFYTPLLPILEVILHLILRIEVGNAYRLITGFTYIAAPVSVFFLGWYISRYKIGGIISGFSYSILPSVFDFTSDFGVRGDKLTDVLEPRRYTNLVRWGEGPHIFGLMFLPLAMLFFVKAVRDGKFKNFVFSAVFTTLVALSNAMVLYAMIIFYLLAGISLVMEHGSSPIEIIKRIVKLFILSLGMSAFWYNISFVTNFFGEGGGAVNNWLAMGIWGILLFTGGIVLLFTLLNKLTFKIDGFNLIFPWFLAMFAIVFVYYASGESKLEYAPQALRLNLEVDMGLSLLLGIIGAFLFAKLWQMRGSLKFTAKSAAVFLSIAVIAPLLLMVKTNYVKMQPFTAPLESLGKRLEDTAEYRVSKYLEKSTEANTRVVAPGNYGFYLNYFTNVSQLRGALFQASTHSWPDHIYYQLTNGGDAQISLAWLKIGNISRLIYTTAASGEIYKDYKAPMSKFESVLSRQYEEKGDVYFNVPLKDSGPAKIVDPGQMKSLNVPENAIDEKPIYDYLEWMEANSSKNLKFEKINNDNYKISGEVQEGEAILVQQTYSPGWRAQSANGDNHFKIKKDSLGFLIIEPKRGGDLEINLKHGISWQVWSGWLVSFVTVLFIIRHFYRPLIFINQKEVLNTELIINQPGHNIFHHLYMVIFQEINNSLWLVAGLVITAAGFAVFKFSTGSFYVIAIGLPLFLAGLSLSIFKLYEIILTLINPARIKKICIFCEQ